MTESIASNVTLYHLIIFQANPSAISSEMVRECQKSLDKVINTKPDNTDIDIWIDSPGGSAHSAYKLILDLRSRCRKLRAVIPDYAKSAATLMLLGVDQLFMKASAELGPLDVQMEHPDREREFLSGLDIANALDSLGRSAMMMTISYTTFLVEATDLPRLEVLKATLDFTARFMQPIVAKLDPHKLHQASNLLEVAGDYGTRLLEMRNVSPPVKLNKDDTKKLIGQLGTTYKSHGFIIGRQEADKLGLPVSPIEDYPRASQVQELWKKFAEADRTVMEVFPDAVFDLENKIHSNGKADSDSCKGDAHEGHTAHQDGGTAGSGTVVSQQSGTDASAGTTIVE